MCIRDSLSGASVPSLTGARDRARQTVSGINGSGGTKSLAPAEQVSGGGRSAAPTQIHQGAVVRVDTTGSTTRVNGQSVPTCSHGGLCHGALLRQMGGR